MSAQSRYTKTHAYKQRPTNENLARKSPKTEQDNTVSSLSRWSTRTCNEYLIVIQCPYSHRTCLVSWRYDLLRQWFRGQRSTKPRLSITHLGVLHTSVARSLHVEDAQFLVHFSSSAVLGDRHQLLEIALFCEHGHTQPGRHAPGPRAPWQRAPRRLYRECLTPELNFSSIHCHSGSYIYETPSSA